MDKKKSACCFIGHRVVPNAIYSDIAYQTECKVFDYISQGFIDFYVGGLTGYDLIASLAVINAKRIFPHARLNLVLPLEDQVAKAKKHDTLSEQYATEETKMRDDLQNTVNDLFRNIYNGGFSLSLDEKYNIQINVIDQEAGFSEDVETSTAQSISVIFAFIAGVIKMARQSQQADNAMLVSEPYPLVMDAPLSAFDKTRIKTVCEVLPAVAEQVIIFIKDTDGDLAEENLGSKVGQRYMFDKKNEFEVYIV